MQRAISYTTPNPLTRHDRFENHLNVSSSTSPDLPLGQHSDVIIEMKGTELVMRFRRQTDKTYTKDAVIATMVSENAVVVIGRRGCCMCLVIRRLLQGLGVRLLVFEIEEEEEEEIIRGLSKVNQGTNHGLGGINGNVNDFGGMIELPAVMVGGKLLGGVEKVMATHVTGELVPILKDVGALWL